MSVGFKQATVASGDVPSTQSDFPVYIDLKRMNGGSSMTQAEADSIRVYADSAKTTEWAREIVSVDEMHVKVPSLTSTTSIFVDWDGSRSDYAVTDTYGRNAVWSDYEFVSHDGGGTDSTGNYTPTANGGVTAGDVAGQIGVATDFDGIDDSFTFGPKYINRMTLSCWTNLDVKTNTYMMSDFGGTPGNAWILRYDDTNWEYNIFSSGGGAAIAESVDSSPTGTWKYIVGTNDLTDVRLYVNGSNTATGATQIPTNTGGAIHIGKSRNNINFNGQLDECRISELTNSANWITTEYNNQNDESGFWGTWSDVTVATDTTKFFNMM